MNTLPPDYLERVYAGVLGKITGVYLGRPVESWSAENIAARFGFVDRYLNPELGTPLVVTDDDIAGAFTFLRALEDYGYTPDLTPRQIGQTWLNYIIEGRTILWWGGLYHSTEHTAYLNLKEGIPAPRSGSLAQNGPVIAWTPLASQAERWLNSRSKKNRVTVSAARNPPGFPPRSGPASPGSRPCSAPPGRSASGRGTAAGSAGG